MNTLLEQYEDAEFARPRFVEWAKREGLLLDRIHTDGPYTSEVTRGAWAGWLAALNKPEGTMVWRGCAFDGPPPSPFESWGAWVEDASRKLYVTGVQIKVLTAERVAEWRDVAFPDDA